ncbi:hypothetical protein G5C65_35575 [Streptomyces sp. SB3404]|uniref:Lipoprotein n=2 Tax=Streptomyces boncukensis TaxID=2711219 RepID=A0A6G4X9M6_9ACTN|nr:hypothetical protein [Streptomyces boncukensis]
MRHGFRSPAPRSSGVVALALLGALAAGCGDDTGSDPGSDSPSASAPRSAEPDSGPLGKTEVRKALLTVGDFPAGWSRTDLDDDGTSDLDAEDETCDRFLDTLDGDDARTDASRDFEKSHTGPFVSSGVASYGTGRAKKVMRDFARLGSECRAFTSKDEDDGSEVAFTVKPLSMPDFGDESEALRLTGKARGGASAKEMTLTVDLVLARVGPSTTGVANMSVLGSDSQVTAEVMERAVSRLRRVQDDG